MNRPATARVQNREGDVATAITLTGQTGGGFEKRLASGRVEEGGRMEVTSHHEAVVCLGFCGADAGTVEIDLESLPPEAKKLVITLGAGW